MPAQPQPQVVRSLASRKKSVLSPAAICICAGLVRIEGFFVQEKKPPQSLPIPIPIITHCLIRVDV